MIQLLAEHRVAANLAMIIMILAGVWAIKGIPSQLDPPMHFPTVTVEVQWRGAAAEDVEELVTTPIEQRALVNASCQLKRCASMAPRIDSATSMASSSVQRSSNMPNSSPPSRATMSVERMFDCTTSAICRSTFKR